jgi:hypothetical protein
MVKINIKLNSTTDIEASGETLQDVMRSVGVLFDSSVKLNQAGEKMEDWTFQHRNPKGFNFYGMAKLDGSKELPFGETKDGNNLFPKEIGAPYSGGGGSAKDWG